MVLSSKYLRIIRQPWVLVTDFDCSRSIWRNKMIFSNDFKPDLMRDLPYEDPNKWQLDIYLCMLIDQLPSDPWRMKTIREKSENPYVNFTARTLAFSISAFTLCIVRSDTWFVSIFRTIRFPKSNVIADLRSSVPSFWATSGPSRHLWFWGLQFTGNRWLIVHSLHSSDGAVSSTSAVADANENMGVCFVQPPLVGLTSVFRHLS